MDQEKASKTDSSSALKTALTSNIPSTNNPIDQRTYESLINRLQLKETELKKATVNCYVQHLVGPTAIFNIDHSACLRDEILRYISESLQMGNIVYNQSVRIINLYSSKTQGKHLLVLQPHL